MTGLFTTSSGIFVCKAAGYPICLSTSTLKEECFRKLVFVVIVTMSPSTVRFKVPTKNALHYLCHWHNKNNCNRYTKCALPSQMCDLLCFSFSGNLKMDPHNRSFDYSFSVDSPAGLNQGFLLPDNAIDSSVIPDTPRYTPGFIRMGHRAILQVHNNVPGL